MEEVVIEYVLSICFTVLSVGVLTFLRYMTKKYDLEEYMPIFDQYVQEGIYWSKKKILDEWKDVDVTKMSNDEFINNAVQYVLKNAPTTLKKLGVTEENVREKVETMIMIEYGEDIALAHRNTRFTNNDIEEIE